MAKVAVKDSRAKPYDPSCGPALLEIALTETFTGDIDGQSTVHALQVRHEDGSASMASVQRLPASWQGARGALFWKGLKSSTPAESRPPGSSFRGRAPAT